jgi:hypothetical protein
MQKQLRQEPANLQTKDDSFYKGILIVDGGIGITLTFCYQNQTFTVLFLF